MDTPQSYDEFKFSNGYIKRRIRDSEERQLYTPVHADFLRTGAFLPPSNKLSLKFYRADDAFLLLTPLEGTSYRLKITDLRLHYSRVVLAENIPPPKKEHYLLTRTELRRFPIASGLQTTSVAIHRDGRLPTSIVIGQVLTAACEGSFQHNPFNFAHFDLSRLNLTVNGEPVPAQPYTPDFENSNFAREYYALFSNLGLGNNSNLVTIDQFKGGCALFATDLSPDSCSGRHFHPSAVGTVELCLSWSKPIARPLTILCYLTFEEIASHSREEGTYTVEVI